MKPARTRARHCHESSQGPAIGGMRTLHPSLHPPPTHPHSHPHPLTENAVSLDEVRALQELYHDLSHSLHQVREARQFPRAWVGDGSAPGGQSTEQGWRAGGGGKEAHPELMTQHSSMLSMRACHGLLAL